jgi:UDP-glucose 4-epimerase
MPAGSPVFNVCTGRMISILDVAHTIAGLCGVSPAIDFQPARAGEVRVSLGDPTRAAAVLGIRATTDLRTGLQQTLATKG